jgi:hypothetical protein
MIYFGDNLEDLVRRKQEELRQRQEQLQQRGVRAF